ncbi:MAG: virulence factor [Actinomycetota bacterium]|jgi:hypothetical protein|nr:virulence factor [Actinomycetota bacterium]|tara:strand:+ start:253 stop:588 length:336 start_codon:yes stop_codon:yes gene_type:complete
MTGRRRRRRTQEITVISWRDIPAQVTAVSEGDKETTVLSDRFQHAIDRAAAIAGFTETNAYLAEWRRNTHPLSGCAGDAVKSLVAQLEAEHSSDRLEALVLNGGLDAISPG